MKEEIEETQIASQTVEMDTEADAPRLITPEEKEEFERIYEGLGNAYKEKYAPENKFMLADETEAKEFADVLLTFNNEHYVWNKQVWQGVLSLNREITEMDLTKGFTVSLQAIEYIFYIVSNPTGKGIEDAIWFNENIEVLQKIFSSTQSFLQMHQEELETIEAARNSVAAAHQGFYFDGIEEFKKLKAVNLTEGEAEESCESCGSCTPDCTCSGKEA